MEGQSKAEAKVGGEERREREKRSPLLFPLDIEEIRHNLLNVLLERRVLYRPPHVRKRVARGADVQAVQVAEPLLQVHAAVGPRPRHVLQHGDEFHARVGNVAIQLEFVDGE